jgi:hypothetical protein
MGAEEESRKIQNVIDSINREGGEEHKSRSIQNIIGSINREWGEEHEEKRKKIIIDNVLVNPILLILFVSIVYLSPFFIFMTPSLFSPNKVLDAPWEIVSAIFNAPYYFFDLRVSVIMSIASILLSLYVSVGKYADDSKEIFVTARRAAYRNFAKIVGYIVFSVFVVNFWHGLLAGYFQGGLSVSAPFRALIGSPDWGKKVVPENMDLSRYGEMPLWILIFFAWFTISSALMLTYNEEDILVRNVSKIRNYNRVSNSGDESVKFSYYLAEKSFESPENDPFNKGLKNVFTGNSQRSSSTLSLQYIYSGFKFNLKMGDILWNVSIIRLVYGLLFLVASTDFIGSIFFGKEYPIGINWIPIAFVLVGEVALLFVNINYLYREIYTSRKNDMSGRESIYEYFKYNGENAFIAPIMRFLMATPVTLFSAYLMYQVFALEGGWSPQKTEFLVVAVLDILSVGTIYYLVCKIKRILRSLVEDGSRKYVKKEFSEFINGSKGEFSKEPNYLLIPYFYYLMLDIEKVYSNYKSKIGNKE